MTTFLTEPLRDEPLIQKVEVLGGSRIIIASIAPYLFFYNNPSGTVVVKIKSGAITIFSQDIDLSLIKSQVGTTADYMHLFYPVIPAKALLLEKGEYSISIEAGTYSYSNGSYLGWSSQHENIQSIFSYTPIDDTKNPLALRIKVFNKGMVR